METYVLAFLVVTTCPRLTRPCILGIWKVMQFHMHPHVHASTCMCIHMHVLPHVHASTCTCIHMHILPHASIHLHVLPHVHVHVEDHIVEDYAMGKKLFLGSNSHIAHYNVMVNYMVNYFSEIISDKNNEPGVKTDMGWRAHLLESLSASTYDTILHPPK